MTIQVLSDQLASQIAAGEVVERPYSVVKELVENGIDAGATTINVDIRQAGRESIQVADNGCGIPAAEIETAFQRHATSKVSSVSDLEAIATLGFRGEALAAIAAVSQLTAVSRAEGETAGTRLTLEGGVVKNRQQVGAPQGTVISVNNLFYNTPARLKFLKSNSTEKQHIDEFISRMALAYPAIRFRLVHNGRITFQTSGNGSVLDVLIAMYGPQLVRQLLEIRPEAEADDAADRPDRPPPVQVTGFIGPPSVHYSNRSHIVLFVNGRWIKDNRLTYAIIQAYHTLLPTGRYPLAVLFLSLSPSQVDVNVHPTKTEVRFRGDKAPFGAVQRAVRQTLVADAPFQQTSAWALGSQIEAMSQGWEGSLDNRAFVRPETAQTALDLTWTDPETGAPAEPSESQLPIMRVVGQVGAAYIITEGPDGLFLIDQQAAHERIVYEQAMRQWNASRMEKKTLSAGTAVTLAPDQVDWLENHLPTLADIGFQIEPFGPQTMMVRTVPTLVAAQDAAQILLALVTRGSRLGADQELTPHLLQIMAEAAAIRGGQTLTMPQMTQLIQQLEKCEDPMTNPQGKPTFIYLSVAQLAREFGRF